MFDVRRAEPADLASAIAVLTKAFATDPLLQFFFREDPRETGAGTAEFFSLLLQARLALDMPALVLLLEGQIIGAAMGYDTRRPTWPASLAQAWSRFEADTPGLVPRLARYEAICDAHQPAEPHHYLGVIGMLPWVQGRGAGRVLLDAFCSKSQADPASHGVFLETSSPASLRFYLANGFALLGQGSLDDVPLWCLFRRTA